MNILTIEHVSKSYAAYSAQDNVNRQVRKQSIFGMLGPNGAGKT